MFAVVAVAVSVVKCQYPSGATALGVSFANELSSPLEAINLQYKKMAEITIRTPLLVRINPEKEHIILTLVAAAAAAAVLVDSTARFVLFSSVLLFHYF